jgi:hypothetical protein
MTATKTGKKKMPTVGLCCRMDRITSLAINEAHVTVNAIANGIWNERRWR